ncbi:MAG: NAD-glutamate dehydrogenase [Acidimicrobiia bacterium]|nr:NAD-glutamate dehydrogenase [Acidimicrobiia bacterium]
MSTDGFGQGESAIIDELVRRVSDDDTNEVIGSFARAYLRRIPADYLASHSVENFTAQVQGFFDFVNARSADEVAIRIFNPEMATHGYVLSGAVVEIATRDMAFLVDSVTNEIEDQGHVVARVLHPVIGIERDADGAITAVLPARTAASRESIQHYELGRRLNPEEMETLESGIRRALLDVRRAVDDFEPMQGAIFRMIKIARAGISRYGKEEVEEAVTFLEWLLDLNFVFLGYREYQLTTEDGERMVSVAPGSGLGILRAAEDSAFVAPVPTSTLHPAIRERYESGQLLVITKTNSPSRVHRRAKMDYIGVRHIAPDGSVIGEARLLGLFTTKAYMAPADSIAVLQSKLQQIIEAEDLIEGSHFYKQVVQLFNSFPTDELFATPTDDIRESILGIVDLQERKQIRLFVRRDLLQRSVSLLVVMPRDRFNAELRMVLQDLFLERFGGTSIDYRLALGETDTARLHFTVWVTSGALADVSISDLEAEVVAAAQTWEERLLEKLIEKYGSETGHALSEEWAGRFPRYYRSSVPLESAVGDIGKLDEMVQAADGRAVVGIQNEHDDEERLTRLAVYRADGKLELSAIMPTLEALGLRVVEEVPTRLKSGSSDMFIHDFGVLDSDGALLDLEEVAPRVCRTVAAVLEGVAESDALNRLIISAGLTHQQVRILRAYRTYWQRVSPGFTVGYINDTFAAHPDIAADLVKLFEARFDPDHVNSEETLALAELHLALDQVASLDEDRILRGFLGLIMATERTSAFCDNQDRLAFKFRSANVPGMPQPAPVFEIFVYANDVEGIHLRGGLVARGGIRWSTRKEDYRTEVLGLMKAQMTKNAVIVPTGSKGGFVLRHQPDAAELMNAVRSGYVTFIRGLLDLTDNLVAGNVVHPERVRVHDGPDPYLVVAADKGTATFSDTANGLAAEYGFWLDDAFASGGSAGYDHKALGITARGAWESVKWHFRELGVDVARDPFTVVGVGDMSGDVFGNGMLLSPTIRLVAAFDHRNIFLDPNPDPSVSFAERQRLFALPRSSWSDYDLTKLSAGGAIYDRKAKRIEVSAEAQQALDLPPGELTPDELINAILKAPVDLLWNGGIGTYVKASTESHDEVGDRVNDALRVDGSQLRFRVVGEGGNLGLTQQARIEFAGRGGRVYTDFIDNAGGVHCSDREVNLKVLLGLAEATGDLTLDERNGVVAEVVDDVVEAILYDNFLQAQILAQDVERSGHHIEDYEDLMVVLETEGSLDRANEYLPTTDEMHERAGRHEGMTAPELSVLLAYAKRTLRQWLLDSDLPDWPDFQDVVVDYFPPKVAARFGHLVPSHPLRRELVATIVANRVVNSKGVTFVTRLMAETGAAAATIVRAYHIARAVVDARERWRDVEALVGHIPMQLARELMNGIDDLVEAVARWYLVNPGADIMSSVIAQAKPAFDELAATMAQSGPSKWRSQRDAAVADWVAQGVPSEVAHRHVFQEDLIHAPDIIEVARSTNRPVREVADLFLLAGPAFELDWLEAQVATLPLANRWQRRATQTVDDDLVLLRRQLAERILTETTTHEPQEALESYLLARTHEVGRLTRFMRSLAADGITDIAPVVVAIRQIRNLAR